MGQRRRSSSRIVLVPFPAQGHVSPMLHLARLLHARGLDATLATPDFIHRRLVASGAGGGCRFASIPSGLDAEGDATPEFAAIERAMESHMPAHLERLLLLPPPPPEEEEEEEEEAAAVACVVVDLVASWAIPVARRCGVHVAGFWPAMLATFRIISAIPELIHRGLISEYGSPLNHQDQVAAEEPLTLAGQAKLSAKELPWLVGNPATQRSRFIFWLRVLERAKSVQYLLVNSFPDEAGQHEQSSHRHHHHLPRPLPIGPLMLAHRTSTNISMWEADRSCLRWLQQHPPGSVVYVSFGSWVAPLSPETIAEIAFGLEAAGRPFLWVLKEDESWRAGLPIGFPGSRPGGMIVSWAPQEEVLTSPAVGCYLTHCGWNSTLEAIQYEKRLLCHPVAGDQFVNAAFIVKVWGIGAMLDGAGRSAVEDGIRRAMESDEGEEMQASVERLRRRVMGNGEASSKAMENLQCFLRSI